MKKTLTQYDIAEELMNDINAAWTRAGAFALAEYFEQIEMDTNEELDFDAVAIRCDFSQYESLQDWAKDYCPSDWVNFLTYENPDKAIREYIQERGELIEFNGGIIVSSF
jgi:hypothetical protein